MALANVCRAIHLYPFTEFCKVNGLSTTPSFKLFKLPTLLSYEDDIYIPWEAACNALGHIALKQGVSDFGARSVIDNQLSDCGDPLEKAVLSSATLHLAICKMKLMIKSELTNANISCSIANNQCCLKMTTNGMSFEVDAWSNFMLLLSVVRQFTGEQWQPKDIIMPYNKEPSAFIRSNFPNSRFSFAPYTAGFLFPSKLLSYPPLGSKTTLSKAGFESELKFIQNESMLPTEKMIKGLARAYTDDKPPQLKDMADILGKSGRTIQRALKTHGMSYSDVLDELRYEKASVLLKNLDMKISEISYKLGYSTTSHFIRSFKRITSMTPKQYRSSYFLTKH